MGRRGLFPDLILSAALDSPELLSAIVIDGIRSQNGMGSFANVIDAQGVEDIRTYLIERANITLQARQAR
jgi:mono/diheme cytochrome c family protein